MKTKAFKAALPYTLPICIGFLFLGMSYGFLMRSKGFSFVYPMFMSLFIFAGSMEFVTVELLLSAFHPLHAFFLALMVNARHLFYGISMLEKYKNTGWKKPYLIYGMCDESFTINCTVTPPPDVDKGTVCRHVHQPVGGIQGPPPGPHRPGLFTALPAGIREPGFYTACHGPDHPVFFYRQKIRQEGGRAMTAAQSILTIAAVVLGTMATRFLPFFIFPEGKEPPRYITYLGTVLPYAVIGLLVVYCLKDAFSDGHFALPELTAILFIVVLHKWKKNTLLSIGCGTVLYMFLVQTIF